MDLSLKISDTRLNIRVTVILRTPAGIIFEYDRNDFFYAAGGRIKLNESSAQAAVREIFEELGLRLSIDRLGYLGIIEDFYVYGEEKYHELNFVYEASAEIAGHLPDGFYCLDRGEIAKADIRPAGIRDYILRDNPPAHTLIAGGETVHDH